MKKILYIFLALTVLLISSCNTDFENPDTGNDISFMHKEENEFIVAENTEYLKLPIYEYDTLNPLFTKSSSVREAMRLIYEPLFDIKADYTTEPVLAESYSVSDGGKKVTVNLKQGITFHDGVKFNANDVKYTVDTIRGYQGKYLEYMKDVKSCEKAGEYTVIFNLTRPVANFTALLTFPIIKNKSSITADATFIPNGTGPYKYTGKGDIKEVKLVINESWREILPSIKEVSLLTMTDKQTAIYAFGANEVDCITGRAMNLSKYSPKGQNNIYSYTSNDLTLLGMNFYNPIFWGKNTRQACSYLIDKEYIMKNVVYNRGKQIDVPVNPDSWYYGNRSEVYNYDTAKAEELLLLDGWARNEKGEFSRTFNGENQNLKFNILVNGENEEKVNIANEVAQTFINMGIPVGINAVSYADYCNLLSLKQYDMVVCEVAMPNNMDPYMLLSSAGNYFTYSNPEMDKLLTDIGAITDKQAMMSYYKDICDLFIDDAPFIPLFFREGTLICNTRVIGTIEPGPENVFANIDEWYMYNPNSQ